jgi:hypothetical protein
MTMHIVPDGGATMRSDTEMRNRAVPGIAALAAPILVLVAVLAGALQSVLP